MIVENEGKGPDASDAEAAGESPSGRIHFSPPAGGRVDLLVIAGEHSGDGHAAQVVREIRRRSPGLAISALGGPALAQAGAQLLIDLTGSSVIGYVEVIRRYRSFFRPLFEETLRWIGEHRPRAVLFVDYGGFNLRVADAMRARGLSVKGWGGIKTLYYISPQVWASRPGRRFSIARNLDAMAVIFPFEVDSYADTELPVEFVGHPFLSPDYRPPVRYAPNAPVLLLPGSRRPAVARIFPVLLAAHRAFGGRPAVVLYPSSEIASQLGAIIAAAGAADVTLIRSGEEGDTGLSGLVPGAFSVEPASGSQPASAVLTSSGTISMHCALAGIPGAIAFRIDPLTYWLGRMLVNVPNLGLANLLLKEPMYPEYIQAAATPRALAEELTACVEDPARRERAASQAARLRELLTRPAGGTAADWLERHLD
jgi:lipid-A-disaccharide synthase